MLSLFTLRPFYKFATVTKYLKINVSNTDKNDCMFAFYVK